MDFALILTIAAVLAVIVLFFIGIYKLFGLLVAVLWLIVLCIILFRVIFPAK